MSYISDAELNNLLQNPFLREAVKKIRVEIRDKALLYAEYAEWSKAQISGETALAIRKDEWCAEVQRIEFALLADHPPVYTRVTCNKWDPLGVFFEGVSTRWRVISTLTVDATTGELIRKDIQ